MIKVQKENVQYTIDEKDLQVYLNDGFKEIKPVKEEKKTFIEKPIKEDKAEEIKEEKKK